MPDISPETDLSPFLFSAVILKKRPTEREFYQAVPWKGKEGSRLGDSRQARKGALSQKDHALEEGRQIPFYPSNNAPATAGSQRETIPTSDPPSRINSGPEQPSLHSAQH